MTMQFIHDPTVLEAYPNNYTMLFSLRDIHDPTKLDNHTDGLIRSVSSNHIENVVIPERRRWDQVFKTMGAPPDLTVSLDILAEKFLEGNLRIGQPIVDLYNHYSLFRAIPMGAYDMDKIAGPLRLAVVRKGLPFIKRGNEKGSPPKTKGREVVYLDEEKVICRYWNKEDCFDTRITQDTRNIVVVFDLLLNNDANIDKIVEDCSRDFQSYLPEARFFAAVTGRGRESDVAI